MDRGSGFSSMNQQSGLTVRRHSRREIRLEALLRVSGACSSQVRLTGSSGAEDGWVRAFVLDASEGGLRIECGVFFPRRSILHLKVTGAKEGEPLLATDIRVQRAEMTGGEGRYSLGTAFVDRSAATLTSVAALLRHLGSVREDAA